MIELLPGDKLILQFSTPVPQAEVERLVARLASVGVRAVRLGDGVEVVGVQRAEDTGKAEAL